MPVDYSKNTDFTFAFFTKQNNVSWIPDADALLFFVATLKTVLRGLRRRPKFNFKFWIFPLLQAFLLHTQYVVHSKCRRRTSHIRASLQVPTQCSCLIFKAIGAWPVTKKPLDKGHTTDTLHKFPQNMFRHMYRQHKFKILLCSTLISIYQIWQNRINSSIFHFSKRIYRNFLLIFIYLK